MAPPAGRPKEGGVFKNTQVQKVACQAGKSRTRIKRLYLCLRVPSGSTGSGSDPVHLPYTFRSGFPFLSVLPQGRNEKSQICFRKIAKFAKNFFYYISCFPGQIFSSFLYLFWTFWVFYNINFWKSKFARNSQVAKGLFWVAIRPLNSQGLRKFARCGSTVFFLVLENLWSMINSWFFSRDIFVAYFGETSQKPCQLNEFIENFH